MPASFRALFACIIMHMIVCLDNNYSRDLESFSEVFVKFSCTKDVKLNPFH